MIDFNINHYLVDENIEEKDPHRFDNFYGELEDKPETERELFKLQAELLQFRKQSTWNKMFELCWQYMQSLIKKRLSGKTFMEPSELLDKSTAATMAFMNQYITNPNFEVGASFAGMMKWKVVEVLYKKNINDTTISLDKEFNDDNNSTLEDVIKDEASSDVFEDIVSNVSSSKVFEEVLSELDEVYKNDEKSLCLIYSYVLLFIKKPRANFKKDFIKFWDVDYKLDKVIETTLLEVRNRLISNY